MNVTGSFGSWLRQRRKALDLTQVELAEQVACSVITIQKMEADERRPSKLMIERLADALVVSQAQRPAFAAFARRTAVSPSASAIPVHTMPSTNLPPVPSFIGRVEDLAQIAEYLGNPACQLLTLVGAGGVGKTYLALQAAHQMSLTYTDGAYFVSLAPVGSVDLLAHAIGSALKLSFSGHQSLAVQLVNYLRDQAMLLVLDNFEHLMDGADLLAELLTGAPRLKLLVTSREPLNLREEWVLQVSGLDVPLAEPGRAVEQIETYSAVQLFLERAHRMRRDFSLANEQSSVIRVCQLVEGMPLGIELAAAWLKTMTCTQIADEIERSLDFLATPLRNAPERHRSIRTVFDHSWKLLTPHEQAIFRKIAVFRGGFEREAAERVANASLRTLTALVDKSLLRVAPSGRYEIHELLRQYCEEQLAAADEGQATQRAHCQYYADFMQKREADVKGRRQLTALNEIEADFENVRVAWNWAVRHKDVEAIDCSLESLYLFCQMRSQLLEGDELFWQAQERLATDSGDEARLVRGRLLSHWGQMWRWAKGILERYPEIKARVEGSLTLARSYDDRAEAAFCLWTLGCLSYDIGDASGALALFQESLTAYRELDDGFYMACAADYLGSAYITLNRLKSISFSQQSLDLRRRVGDKFGMTLSLTNLAAISALEGQYMEAERQLREIDAILREMGSLAWAWRCTSNLALVTFCQGHIERARVVAKDILASGSASALGHGSALITLSLVAIMDEDYLRAKQLAEQCLLAGSCHLFGTTKFTEGVLSIATSGLRDYQTARQYLQTALEAGVSGQSVIGMAWSLPSAALLLAEDGRKERAVEVLALAFHHPASANGWMERWSLLTRMRAELEAELGPDTYRAAWARGQTSNLVEVATLLQATLQSEQERT